MLQLAPQQRTVTLLYGPGCLGCSTYISYYATAGLCTLPCSVLCRPHTLTELYLCLPVFHCPASASAAALLRGCSSPSRHASIPCASCLLPACLPAAFFSSCSAFEMLGLQQPFWLHASASCRRCRPVDLLGCLPACHLSVSAAVHLRCWACSSLSRCTCSTPSTTC